VAAFYGVAIVVEAFSLSLSSKQLSHIGGTRWQRRIYSEVYDVRFLSLCNWLY